MKYYICEEMGDYLMTSINIPFKKLEDAIEEAKRRQPCTKNPVHVYSLKNKRDWLRKAWPLNEETK